MLKHYSGLSAEYDSPLSTIPHYVLYPEMAVAVGARYRQAPVRVLVLGESPYIEKPEPSNTPDRWYERRDHLNESTPRWISTRGVFNNVIVRKKPSKSKAIFHALSNALAASDMAVPEASSPLQSIAYMNYFQRPAERPGKSILPSVRDAEESDRVITAVTGILKPHLVVFATRLGWRYARRGLVHTLNGAGIRTVNVPHPATSWWNRPSRPMKNRTGRQCFVEAIAAARLAAQEPAGGTSAAPAVEKPGE